MSFENDHIAGYQFNFLLEMKKINKLLKKYNIYGVFGNQIIQFINNMLFFFLILLQDTDSNYNIITKTFNEPTQTNKKSNKLFLLFYCFQSN